MPAPVVLIIFFEISSLSRKFLPPSDFHKVATWSHVKKSKRESTPDVGFDLIFCVNKSEEKKKKSFHGIFPVDRLGSEKRMSNN